uniref:Uncharacterized protein n=1 Tax=Astyanax mexicanus TaxID=7994 RepID=A0A8B9JF27_ASTMX
MPDSRLHDGDLNQQFPDHSGADQASATVHSNLHTARSQIQQVRQLLTEAEKELKESKAEESERLQLETQEEEEIPEAYLRED